VLSPRGQAVLEAKILSSASDSASSICPRTFYFGLVKMCVMLELVILSLSSLVCMLNVVTRTMIDDDDGDK